MKNASRRWVAGSLALVSFFFYGRALAALPRENRACLKCHGNRIILSLSKEQRLAIVVPSPAKQGVRKGNLSLYIDEERFRATAHHALSCTDCHTDIKGIPHSQRLEKVSCAPCHQEIADDYTKDMQATGIIKACSECHDPHATTSCTNTTPQQRSGICLPYHKGAGYRASLPNTRGYPWLDGIGIAGILASFVFVGAHILARLITRQMRRH